MNASKVFHVAGEPIKGLHNEHIEFVLTSFIHQVEQTIASHHGTAGASSIVKRCNNVQTLTLSVSSAER
ncbi:hypothetical protein MESS2_810030 [Mesorhizobium metallidurans STM 2683]|uniref:Uncharacterized protein n=1 Tax=Mesorhizobium metallidurans STM 2683 TaxID=1297569 RepID=M5FAV0_9HYPH|nr:hypothetical protein MESS2_810030 [Mesorhizobium metallidurans STM 2683]